MPLSFRLSIEPTSSFFEEVRDLRPRILHAPPLRRLSAPPLRSDFDSFVQLCSPVAMLAMGMFEPRMIPIVG